MLREKEIKSALIDYLLDSKLNDELSTSVLINELVVGKKDRRADIVLANGKLVAYEIKSDADSLNRLNGQVDAYLKSFDKVVLVTTFKHLDKVLRSTPADVEILCVSKSGSEFTFKVKRRGKTCLVKDRSSLAEFMPVVEIEKLLRSKKKLAGSGIRRSDAIELVESLPIRDVRNTVMSFLKNRYSNAFNRFLECRGSKTTPIDLSLLKNWSSGTSVKPEDSCESVVAPRRMIRLPASSSEAGKSSQFVAPRLRAPRRSL